MAGKEGVTYDQVKAAADALVAEGRRPSIRAVRERLNGSGSPNTIHRHLAKWRDARPEAPAPSVDLAPSIIREINGEIQRAVAAARAEIEGELAQARAEAADLAAAGELLEGERDGLAEQLAALVRERDVQAGKAAEQTAEIERLAQELERERRAAEEARIEAAQARLTNEGQHKQLEELRTELTRLHEASRHERQARVDAERELAAAASARDSLSERLAELQGREQSALRELAELRERLQRAQDAANATSLEASELRGQLTGLRDALARAANATPQPAPEARR
jgi:colicin import membrane protein